VHLRFPLRHRQVIRTTNLLERLFLEEWRRTKIVPHAFGERPVLKLMYAAVILLRPAELVMVIGRPGDSDFVVSGIIQRQD
jgi:hypothetical protein